MTRWYGWCCLLLLYIFILFAVITCWFIITYLLLVQCVAVLSTVFVSLLLNTVWCSGRTWRRRNWCGRLPSRLRLLKQHWRSIFVLLFILISEFVSVVSFIVTAMSFCTSRVVWSSDTATITTTATASAAIVVSRGCYWCVVWQLPLIFTLCPFTVFTLNTFIIVLGKTKFIEFGKAWNKSYS